MHVLRADIRALHQICIRPAWLASHSRLNFSSLWNRGLCFTECWSSFFRRFPFLWLVNHSWNFYSDRARPSSRKETDTGLMRKSACLLTINHTQIANGKGTAKFNDFLNVSLRLLISFLFTRLVVVIRFKIF